MFSSKKKTGFSKFVASIPNWVWLIISLVTALLRSLCCAGISLRRPAPRLVFLVFHGVHPSVGLVSVL